MSIDSPDVPGESSAPAPDAPSTTRPEDASSVPFNEHPRWKQVYGENQQYKRFGSVDQLARDQQELSYYRNLVAEYEASSKDAPATPTTQTADAQSEAIQKELRKAEPNLEKLAKMMERLEKLVEKADTFDKVAEAEARRTQIWNQGSMETVVDLMKDNEMEVSRESAEALAKALVAHIEATPRLQRIWFRDYEKGVKEAFKTYREPLEKSLERKSKADLQKSKQPLANLPKAHGAGGGAEGAAGSGPPKSLKEATQRVLARLG